MSSPKVLTKSRFKVGAECPTKLYYLDRPEYANKNKDNSFLEALAEGGFQVGALAKLYFPNGTEIFERDKTKALAQTAKLMSSQKVTVFEAAFSHDGLYLLADVVQRSGNSLRLVEVKAKSFDPHEHETFFTKKGGIKSEWIDYLLDVAFQKYVIKLVHPELNVTASLMLVDKSQISSVDGLNQKFLISKDGSGRSMVTTQADTTADKMGNKLLKEICVDAEVDYLWSQTYLGRFSFSELVKHLERVVIDQKREANPVGQHCKSCEFRTSPEDGLRSGFHECWTSLVKDPSELDARTPIFDLWNFRKSEKLMRSGVFFMDQLHEDDISPTQSSEQSGLSQSQRQWIQVQKDVGRDHQPYIDCSGLAGEITSWNYPLNCIDFETTMVALPFNKGRRPYEQLAFQFSHHILNADGSVEHKTQFINREKGKFPNFDFVRALAKALSGNNGTILRFAAHENTVLCQIREQILNSDIEIPDAKELVAFIESITSGPNDKWLGHRNMVDLCELVKRFYYHPDTKGSNSIKKVLPAVLNDSSFLKNKYSRAIYGSNDGIKSQNYRDHVWIALDEYGKVKDPYKSLPPIFEDVDMASVDSILGSNVLADGGAAMTAYARMQFTEMTEVEASKISNALLKYCELDTLAMVMIVEYWVREILQQKSASVA